MKAAWGGLGVSVIALGLKFAAYWVTGSIALYSDALETTINVVGALTALIALWFSEQPADANHPYGHQKAEYIRAAVEAFMVLATAFAIGREAYFGWLNPRAPETPLVGIAFNGASGIVNLLWALFLIRVGRRWRSPALAASGKHSRTACFHGVSKDRRRNLCGGFRKAGPGEPIDSSSRAANELKDSGLAVSRPTPGATATDFFRRAKMLDTSVVQSKKADPADVARDGFNTLMSGEARKGLSARIAWRRAARRIHSAPTSAFSLSDPLKVTTLRAVIGDMTPVFGLRPGRSRFWQTAKLPKPRSFTSSPATSVETISSSTASINSLD